ncbi:beta-galactosidase [Streptomyces sp. NPDC059499]|uniref:beta-galactosidase n=1 Tax=Streptomyces sp. NPDC059499 TaxID=3346852 RepID=UPI0036A06A03
MRNHLRLPPPAPAPLSGHLPFGDATEATDPIEVTSRYLTRGGRPWFPVSGEFHYTRCPARHWEEELLKMKAGGITVVATYVIWIHHEETEGRIRFDGDRDLRRFAELCARHDLGLIPRIGPWCHAEVRNGGLPDWMLARDCAPRTDDPAYLEPVQRWFAAVGEQLRGMDRAHGGPVVAIQIENELYDRPGHLLTLKRLAQHSGLSAPLWTATAWGGVQLPPDELLPLYGGYPETFWTDADGGWPDTCRKHFFFTHQRDDEGIGADLRPTTVRGGAGAPTDRFPWATCELGGGMAHSYHRRPRVDAADVAALGLTKIGCGSAWQGYYMFHGGTNPTGELTTLQESHATGYPNDLPVLSYDFQAPLGEYGQYRPSYHELRLQHLLLEDFGHRIAPMASALPGEQPTGQDDRSTLRWAVRCDAGAGFLFVNNHQPYEPLRSHPETTFGVDWPDGTELSLPSTPATIPSGAFFCWPLRMRVAGARLEWATAQPVCRVEADGQTVLVLAAVDGIDPELALDASTVSSVRTPSGDITRVDGRILITGLAAGTDALVEIDTADGGRVALLVLDATTARSVYRGRAWDARRLVLCYEGVVFDHEEVRIHSAAGEPSFAVLPAPQVPLKVTGAQVRTEPDGVFTRYRLTPAPEQSAAPVALAVRLTRPAGPAPAPKTNALGRASAPADEDFDTSAAEYRLDIPDDVLDRPDGVLLHIDWTGNVARAYTGDTLVADQFQAGQPWEIGLDRLDATAVRTHGITLRLLSLHEEERGVHLPPAAEPAPERDHREALVIGATLNTTRSWAVRPG